MTLIGHSNGGDISPWLSNENKAYISQLITLDHKRVSMPKSDKMRVLAIQAVEYPTKSGVLPTAIEQQQHGSGVVEIPDSKHMDLTDYGPSTVTDKVKKIISGFINGQQCETLKKSAYK